MYNNYKLKIRNDKGVKSIFFVIFGAMRNGDFREMPDLAYRQAKFFLGGVKLKVLSF
jgi:hypothetical protein